jgi:hypothetical protein
VADLIWMLRSRIIIISDSKNADGNTAADLAEALKDCSACQIEVLPEGVIEATIPTAEIPDIICMAGVCYVRNEMTYSAQTEVSDGERSG